VRLASVIYGTTVVTAEVAELELTVFPPVTETCSVEPLSTVPTRYVAAVAPVIAAQLVPAEVHRFH
jgi:hypothetical protein